MRIRRSLVFVALVLPGCPETPPSIDVGADAPADVAGPICATDGDCDDGRFCTGVERCVAARCQPGTDPCDDGIECTLDSCSESRMRCVSLAPDEDGDGEGDVLCLGSDGRPVGDDCDDTDPDRYPGAAEICDGDDEDCNDATLGGVDDDHDGYVSSACCDGTRCGDDCDDARLGSFPGASEICDGLDQDCDGMVDDGLILDGFVDADGDGWGGPTTSRACPGTPGFDTRGGDCNDDPTSPSARAQSPGQPEICDGIRNDCTAAAPDVGAGSVTWYTDRDGDGFGAATSGTTSSCTPIAGASLFGTDCDDDDRMVSPAAVERCNGVDDNCDGTANFSLASNDTEDDDGDGLADVACPGGNDCNDRDALSGPGETEVCDLRDNDCDTRVDEGAPSAIYYRDIDRDGHGALASGSVVACMPVLGYVLSAGDCSDMDATRYPGATETCDSADEDCDAAIDEAPADDMCSLPNAASYCLAGRCFVEACDVGRRDCDARPENGCETDVRTDAFSCGGCGVSCPGLGTCGGGICIHSRSSMVSPRGWILPRPVAVTIDTPEPGATVVYNTGGYEPGDGSGFFDVVGTTPITITAFPTAVDTVRWRVIHGPGLFEDVQSATATVDTSPSGPRSRVGALIEHLDIGGSGPVATVTADATVTLTYTLQTWHEAGALDEGAAFLWAGNARRLHPMGCTPIPRVAYPGTTTEITTTFVAPPTPGIYPVSLQVLGTGACMAAVGLLGSNDVGWVIVER